MNEEAIVFGLVYASATPHIGRTGCARMGREAVEDWRAFQDSERAECGLLDDIGRGLRGMAWALEEPERAAENMRAREPLSDDEIPF